MSSEIFDQMSVCVCVCVFDNSIACVAAWVSLAGRRYLHLSFKEKKKCFFFFHFSSLCLSGTDPESPDVLQCIPQSLKVVFHTD